MRERDKAKTDDPAIRMKSNPEPTTQEVLAGLVERVTFHNAESGFCVLRAKARGQGIVTLAKNRPFSVDFAPTSRAPSD